MHEVLKANLIPERIRVERWRWVDGCTRLKQDLRLKPCRLCAYDA